MFDESARSPFVKLSKTLIHPGEVLIWNVNTQQNRQRALGGKPSILICCSLGVRTMLILRWPCGLQSPISCLVEETNMWFCGASMTIYHLCLWIKLTVNPQMSPQFKLEEYSKGIRIMWKMYNLIHEVHKNFAVLGTILALYCGMQELARLLLRRLR